MPAQVVEVFLVYEDMTLGEGDTFFTHHTQDGDAANMSHSLNNVCTTLAYPCAAPTTNFIRQLYHTTISDGGALGQGYDKYLKGLADTDAHSYIMATSIHYDLYDSVDGPLAKKPILVFYHLSNRMSVGFPEGPMTVEALAALKVGMGNMGEGEMQRPVEGEETNLTRAEHTCQFQGI